jgi:hypothetical protein
VLMVRPAFTPGSITSASTVICNGATAPTIGSASSATGGDGAISYKWSYGQVTLVGSATTYAQTGTLTPPPGK